MSKTMCFVYFIGSLAKIVLYLHFLYTKDGRHHQIKTKHEWWKSRFSDNFPSFFTEAVTGGVL